MASEQRPQSSGEEVLYARFLVHFLPAQQTPLKWEDEVREEEAWKLVAEREGPGFQGLNALIQQVVRSNLGDEFEVSRLRISRGSLELTFVISAAGIAYKFIKDYPNLRQGMIQLRDDLRNVIKRFFYQAPPPSGGKIRVYGGLTASPAMQTALTVPTLKDSTTSGASTILPRSPDSGSGPLVWYLIISNAALLLFLAILLVWIVALWQT